MRMRSMAPRMNHILPAMFRKPAAIALLLISMCTLPSLSVADSMTDSLATYTNQLKEREKELKALRTRIGNLRKQDTDLQQEEVGTLTQLQILDKEVALTEELLRGLQEKKTHVEAQLEGIRAEHAGAKDLLLSLIHI